MKQLYILILLAFCANPFASAQNYLEHLQERKVGEGTVTVTQSKSIDSLVNGNQSQSHVKKTATNNHPKIDSKSQTTNSHQQSTSSKQAESTYRETGVTTNGTSKKENSTQHTVTPPIRTETTIENEMEIPTIDLRKKVMRKSYKVVGYRVQAYVGGNTRSARQQAESARDKIKMNFPNEPIYVHFYSPRWICRVGNYRSYEEANRMLTQIKKLGYRSATIVRGMITVQY